MSSAAGAAGRVRRRRAAAVRPRGARRPERGPHARAGASPNSPRSSPPPASSTPPAATWPPPANSPPRTRRSPPRPTRSTARIGELEARLRELLLPKDPNDSKDVILEVKAGEGGDESALFAGDLLRMYLRYAERQGWATEVLDDEPTDLGGMKSATIAVRARKRDQRGAGRS